MVSEGLSQQSESDSESEITNSRSWLSSEEVALLIDSAQGQESSLSGPPSGEADIL